MAHLKLPNDLINDVRPFVETCWETKQREEIGVIISATEVIERLLQWFWAVRSGKEVLPKQLVPGEKPRRARLYGRR
jgi:hypothetical protein